MGAVHACWAHMRVLSITLLVQCMLRYSSEVTLVAVFAAAVPLCAAA